MKSCNTGIKYTRPISIKAQRPIPGNLRRIAVSASFIMSNSDHNAAKNSISDATQPSHGPQNISACLADNIEEANSAPEISRSEKCTKISVLCFLDNSHMIFPLYNAEHNGGF